MGDVRVARSGHDVGRAALLHDPAGLDEDEVVGEGERVEGVVRHEHGRPRRRCAAGPRASRAPAAAARGRAPTAARRAAGAAARWRAPGPARRAGPGRARAVPGGACRGRGRPARRARCRARRAAADRDAPRLRGPKATLARAVRWGKSRWSAASMPTARSDGSRWMPAPAHASSSTRTCPAARWTRPASACSAVVLPAPLGPSTATTSPSPARSGRSRSRAPRETRTWASRLTATTARAAARARRRRRRAWPGSVRRPSAGRPGGPRRRGATRSGSRRRSCPRR